MLSEKSRSIADACRFCWMCRHACPAGQVTGKETYTPRARGLLISLDSRGIPLSEDSVDAMYQCCLCGACTNDCATGWDPLVFIREARRDAIARNFLGPKHLAILDRALAGNITDEPVNQDLQNAVAALPEKADTVLYLGHSGQRGGAKASLALISVLRRAGVGFTVLRSEPQCGDILFDFMGMTEEVRTAAVTCLNAIRAVGGKKIVVSDPSCARFFKHECEEMGLMEGLEVVTATAFVESLFAGGALKARSSSLSSATIHDPSRLARDLDETESARTVLKTMGITINEMFLNRKLTRCCGNVVYHAMYPDCGTSMGKARWADAQSTKESVVVTLCPTSMGILSRTAPEGMQAKDIFELVAEAVCDGAP